MTALIGLWYHRISSTQGQFMVYRTQENIKLSLAWSSMFICNSFFSLIYFSYVSSFFSLHISKLNPRYVLCTYVRLGLELGTSDSTSVLLLHTTLHSEDVVCMSNLQSQGSWVTFVHFPEEMPSYWLFFWVLMEYRPTYEIRHSVLQCHQQRTRRRQG